MEEQGPQFSKPDPPANPGKAVSPKLSNRTRLSHCTFIHILYFGIFQRTGRDRVGQRLRQEGEGGLAPHFPHIPPGPATWGAHTQGEGRHRSPLGGGGGTELHPRYTHTHTHTHTPTRTSPLHTGRAGSQRIRALWGQGQGSNSLLTDRRPAPPAPSDSIPSLPGGPPTLRFAWPFSPGLELLPCCWGRKEKGYRAGRRPSLSPIPHAGWSVPGRPQDRLLAGHSLVEVDVA